MRKRFFKTKHFWVRAWERGFNQSEIDVLLLEIRPRKGKHIAVFGKNAIKKAGIKLKNKSHHLVIVMNDNILITMFGVSDLYEFMKTNVKSNFVIL